MNMNWADWAVLAMMAVVMFFIPIVIGKYIDMRIKRSFLDKSVSAARGTLAGGFLLESKMWRVVPGQAFVILADGRVFAFPARKVAVAAFLSCSKAFFEIMSDCGRCGLDVCELQRKLPVDGTMLRVKEGGAIVYFESIFDKGVRTVLGVDAVEVSAFWTELESVRAGIAAKAGGAKAEEVRHG